MAVLKMPETRAHNRDLVSPIMLRAHRRVLWLRSLWAGTGEPHQGVAIANEEIDRILLSSGNLADGERRFYRENQAARELTEAIESDTGFDATPWGLLRDTLELSQPECELLMLAAAAEINPLLHRLYAYLHDDNSAIYASAALAAALFEWPSDTFIPTDSGLDRWFLARRLADSHSEGWIADPAVVTWIRCQDPFDPALSPWVREAPVLESQQYVPLYPQALAAMRDFGAALHLEAGQAIEFELVGSDGSGRRTLATQYCHGLRRRMLIVDTPSLLPPDTTVTLASERITRAVRSAGLAGAALYWNRVDDVDPRFWHAAQVHLDLTFFSACAARTHHDIPRSPRKVVRLDPLTQPQRAALWYASTDRPMPELALDLQLTPAEISHVAQMAVAGDQEVIAACHRILHRAPGEVFSPLVCPYSWDDIVLAESVRSHLLELENQARLRGSVYDEWGFGRLCPMGRGISALFAGPSGTGKTMAAQVIAGSLQRELYRVDLAGVINKYIGETEKRLKQVFDACERSGVVLFFDEADALFGQRTQVKSANDRFANIEIDYLLQRMEQFDGIAILATNRKNDIDNAFLRRLRFIVDFLPPGPAERLSLWQLSLPERAPNGDQLLDSVDFPFLAERFSMTGADIKASAMGAAFLAKAEGARIGMRHVLHAARREMTKHGVVLRTGDL